MLFKLSMSLYFFYQFPRGLLKSPTEIVDLSIFFLSILVSFCFKYFEALLDAYTFRIIMSSK